MAETLLSWWNRYRTEVLWCATICMGILAVLNLQDQFYRLTMDSSTTGAIGAIDLRYRHQEVQAWFAGSKVYGYYELKDAVYPPASYALLWPFLGWMDFNTVRWTWAITSVGAIAWLIYLVLRVTEVQTSLERAFLAVLVLAVNATGQTIGNGQLIIHILPMLLTGIFILQQKSCKWPNELLATGLILWTLVQPAIAAPFFWIVIFMSGTLRPSLVVILGYTALTAFALSFGDTVTPTILDAAERASEAVWYGVDTGGYANLHSLRSLSPFEKVWNFPLSLFVLLILGIWTCRHSKHDLWLILGITAIVARFWSYHRVYNDLLILLPMLTLFRLARSTTSPVQSVMAGALFAITLLSLLVPFRVYQVWPTPWPQFYEYGHTGLRLVVLVFLLYQVHRAKLIKMHQ